MNHKLPSKTNNISLWLRFTIKALGCRGYYFCCPCQTVHYL